MRGSGRRFPHEGVVSDEDHVAHAGLDGSFQPLDRLVDTTEGDEGAHEVEMEREFRAGPLQLLELGEVAQGLLRPARPREQVRSGAQAPHTSGRQRLVAQEFFDGPVVFSQAVVSQGTPLDGGAEGGVDFECAIVRFTDAVTLLRARVTLSNVSLAHVSRGGKPRLLRFGS